MKEKLLGEWFWADRYAGSSAALMPMEPRGLYREMMTEAWRRGARLPNDERQIMLAVRATSEEWARCWPLVRQYWRVDGDYLVNDTQLEIYADAVRRAENAHVKAAAAAAARWGTKAAPQARARGHAQAHAEAQPKDKHAKKVMPALDVQAPAENSFVGAVWGEFLRITGQPDTRQMSPQEWALIMQWSVSGLAVRHVITAMRECPKSGRARNLAYFAKPMKEKLEYLRTAFTGA